MIESYRAPLTASDVKERAIELGADLVGIADGSVMNANPPWPQDPRGPQDITDYDGDRVIVLARRVSAGTARIPAWSERHKYYNDELAVTALEETALELVLWLEDNGYPALIIPPTHVDPWRYDGDPEAHLSPLLSLEHAAVEAGLGSLGLNLQLITPQFGPRVILSAVLSSVPVEPDQREERAHCLGPTCGRCLRACPGDVIEHWGRDWPGCDRYRSPHGFAALTDFLGDVLDQPDADAKRALLRSEASFNLWQSILRGAGVITGCRRCQDVCPVGADYPALLADVLEQIGEDTPAKQERLGAMVNAEQTGGMPVPFEQQRRWIGNYASTGVGTPDGTEQ